MEIRVLHFLNSLGNGGAESFIFNMYRNIDREAIQFDFVLRSRENNTVLIDEVNKMGGRVYIMPEFPKRPYANYKALKLFFKEHKEYKIIHVHANAMLYITPFLLAKKNNIHCRILHSHSTATQNHSLYRVIHRFNRLFLKEYATYFFACGYEAAKWMFKENKFKIINNAIDTKLYVYNENLREKLRIEMRLEDRFVVGHVGRFVEPKNHTYLIDIFKEIYDKNPKASLVLLGDGELLPNIREKVHRLNLQENVLFLGQRSDVADLLQVFDAFVFPSLFEGVPVALIEAQAAGLQCFVSNKVSDKVKITKLVNFLSIEEPTNVWANMILSESNYLREDMSIEIKKNDFDIKDNSRKMQEIYSDIIKTSDNEV